MKRDGARNSDGVIGGQSQTDEGGRQFKLLQALGIRYISAAVLRAPSVKSSIADAVHPAAINDLHAGFCLFQDANDLLFDKSFHFHV